MPNLVAIIQKAGGYSAVARKMGTTRQVVWCWVRVLKRIPAEHVLDLEKVTGTSRHILRPDIYPEEGD